MMGVFVGSALEKNRAVLQVCKENRPGASSEKHSAAPIFPEVARDGTFTQSGEPGPAGAPILLCLLLVTRCDHVGRFPHTKPKEKAVVSAMTLAGL